MDQEDGGRIQPVCDVVMNVPINRGLRKATRDHAVREGDSGMSAVVRKALCHYLNVDLDGTPRGRV
jgi:hypothetical protein